MIISGYLNIQSNGSVRYTKGRVALHIDEISMAIEIKVPDALFEKPKLQAKIEIPEDATLPELIDSEVVENIQELIQVNTGLDMKISIVEPETEG